MAKRTREAADITAMVFRMMRSLEKRAGEGDTDALAGLVQLQAAAGRFATDAAQALRSEPWGYSWTDLGNALGVSRQAAQQRFGGGL